jgi:Mor family transcriptional regulator
MKRDSTEALDRLFSRMVNELGAEGAERMATMIAEEIGGFRLVFPDIPAISRMVRNRQICDRFTGRNHEELAYRHHLTVRQIRAIVCSGKAIVYAMRIKTAE